MEWRPITPVSSALLNTDDEIGALAKTWAAERKHLNEDAVAHFHTRVAREWAVETGLIERIYTLDRGTTELLIERGIDAALIPHSNGHAHSPGVSMTPEEIADIILDHELAVNFLFDVIKDERPLSQSLIRELHVLLTRKQTTTTAVDQFGKRLTVRFDSGVYKTQPNNPTRRDGTVHWYCPPEHVDAEMQRLVDLYDQMASGGIVPEVQAAWLHHRFTQIHPFQDGNGRVARALATLVLLKAGRFPLVVSNDQRGVYIEALEHADQDDLRPLIDMFKRIARLTLVRVFWISDLARIDSAQPEENRLEAAIEIVAQSFKPSETRSGFPKVRTMCEQLIDRLEERLGLLQTRLSEAVGRSSSFAQVVVLNDQTMTRNPLALQEVSAINMAHDFDARTATFHRWLGLRLRDEAGVTTDIVTHFSAMGSTDPGVVIGGMTLSRHIVEGPEENHVVADDVGLCTKEIFQVNYMDTLGDASQRFDRWFEDAFAQGLLNWRGF